VRTELDSQMNSERVREFSWNNFCNMAPLQSIKFQTTDFPIFCTRRPVIVIFWTKCIAWEVFSVVVTGNGKHILPVLQCLKRGIAFVSILLCFVVVRPERHVRNGQECQSVTAFIQSTDYTVELKLNHSQWINQRQQMNMSNVGLVRYTLSC